MVTYLKVSRFVRTALFLAAVLVSAGQPTCVWAVPNFPNNFLAEVVLHNLDGPLDGQASNLCIPQKLSGAVSLFMDYTGERSRITTADLDVFNFHDEGRSYVLFTDTGRCGVSPLTDEVPGYFDWLPGSTKDTQPCLESVDHGKVGVRYFLQVGEELMEVCTSTDEKELYWIRWSKGSSEALVEFTTFVGVQPPGELFELPESCLEMPFDCTQIPVPVSDYRGAAILVLALVTTAQFGLRRMASRNTKSECSM